MADHPRIEALAKQLGGWRTRCHEREPARSLWRAAVLTTGLLCIVAGLLLIALPGPLTIPPMLLGLRIWASEFSWARRYYEALKAQARRARQKVRARRERREGERAGAGNAGRAAGVAPGERRDQVAAEEEQS